MIIIAPPKGRLKNPKLYHAKQTRNAFRTTWQETAVAQILDQHGITFAWQAPFLIDDREIILDFLVKSPRGIPVAVECSTSDDGPSRLRSVADKLDSRFRLMKAYLSVGTVAVLSSTANTSLHVKVAIQQLHRTLAFTDVVITEPEDIITAVTEAGETVFKSLSVIPMSCEAVQNHSELHSKPG